MKPEFFDRLNYQFDIKDMNVQQMRERLAKIPIEKRGELRTKPVPWIYTNDIGFAESLDEITAKVTQQKKTDKPRIGIISGVGAVLTVAPYLNLDCLVDRKSVV